MKPTILYFGAGALLVSGLFLAPSVQAQATASETFSTSTPQATAPTDWTTTFTLPQFDPSLGTLNDIVLTVDSTMSTSLTVQNNGPSPDSGHAFTEIEFFVDDSGLNLNGAGNPALIFNSANFSFDNLASGDSVTSGILAGHGTTNETYTGSTVLSEFTGTGTVTLNGDTATTTVTATSGANTSANQTTSADGNVSVTYDYTVPTPEPSTLGLIAVGGVAACFFRRRSVR